MAIIKQDAFTAASPPVLLSVHSSDVGGGYQGDLLGYMYQIDPSGTLLCSSEDRRVAYGDENPVTPHYAAEVSGRVGDTAAGSHFGCIVRASGGPFYTASGYFAAVQGDGYVSLARLNAGVIIQLGSLYTIPGFNIGTLYTLRLVADGTGPVELSVYLNDDLVIFHSDAAAERIVAPGNGGGYSRFGSTNRPQIYSLLVEDLVGGGGGGDNPPTVLSFAVEDASVVDSTVINISAFSGADVEDTNPAGYAITESTTPPGAPQSATPITSYDLGGFRSATLYPWVFDSAAQVSALYGSPVSVIAVSSLGGGSTIIFGVGFGGGITS